MENDQSRQRCEAPGCDRPVKCKGLCGTHYERSRHGKPLEGAVRRYTQQDMEMLAQGFRRCTGACGEVKPLTAFSKMKAACRECSVAQRTAHKREKPEMNRAAARLYRETHPEQVKAQKKVWYEKDPAARRAHRLMSTYGLTVEQFNAMLASQDGKCAICGTSEPGGKGGVFQVDHCHDSMMVRGLLCDACNRGIGFLRHDIALMASAIAYLSKS